MDTPFEQFKIWQRSSWLYWVYAKLTFASQPYRDDTFEATQIVENLWVGDKRSPCNEDSLKNNNINMIITVVLGATAYFPFDFKYEKADLRDMDGENILDEITRLLPIIRDEIENNRGVLVHCMQGASRSVTVVAAYLIKYHDMSADTALEFMKKKRSCVNPNQGYRDQLDLFEQHVRRENREIIRNKKLE